MQLLVCLYVSRYIIVNAHIVRINVGVNAIDVIDYYFQQPGHY